MPTDYSWFEKTLAVKKRYRVCGTCHYAAMNGYRLFNEDTYQKLFEVTNNPTNEEWFEIEGTHVMNPGVATGATEIERTFNVTLPEDVHAFYKNWGGGFLMLSEFHYILSPSDIVRYCTWLRAGRKEPLDAPWRIIRFCDLGDGHFMALHKKREHWNIIFISVEFGDDHILGEVFGPPNIHGDSFSDWLQKTINRDGTFEHTPPGTPHTTDIPVPPYERLS